MGYQGSRKARLEYLLQNADGTLAQVTDLSVLAEMLAIGGDVSDYSSTTDSLEALADAIGSIPTDDIAAVVGALNNAAATGDVTNTDTLVAYIKQLVTASNLMSSQFVLQGTSPNTSGTANTSTRIELDSNASSVDGTYDPGIIVITSGTGDGQARQIWEYDGTNKYAYVNRDWKVIPDDTSEYALIANSGNSHVNEGLARGGTNNTITLNALASDQNSLYLGQMIFIAAGTGADQARMVVGYNGTTKVATVDADWIVNPDATSVYAMYPNTGFVNAAATANASANTLTRDVIGNKADTAATGAVSNVKSLTAYVKQLVTAIQLIPTTAMRGTDGAALATDLATMQADIDELEDISSHCTQIFPSATNLDCVLTAHASADTWSAWAEIVDTTGTPVTLSSKFAANDGHVTGMITESANEDNTVYMAEIAYGAAKTCISSWRLVSATNKVSSTGQSSARGPHVPAGETIYYRCMCETAGSKTLNVHFRYFLHV